MSPTFRNENGYRFYIWSNEENRTHVHVNKGNNSAKLWIEPVVEVAENKGFSTKELNIILKIAQENANEFKAKYRMYIG